MHLLPNIQIHLTFPQCIVWKKYFLPTQTKTKLHKVNQQVREMYQQDTQQVKRTSNQPTISFFVGIEKE